jgi:hypothetical protein
LRSPRQADPKQRSKGGDQEEVVVVVVVAIALAVLELTGQRHHPNMGDTSFQRTDP